MLLIGFVPLAGAEQRLKVVASIMPLSLIVKDIGGDAVDTELLLPASVSPHDYQLRPSDIKRLLASDIFFWVGPGLEQGLEKASRRHRYGVALFPDIKMGDDPHVWLDLPMVQEVARHVAATLSRRLPTRGAYFHANAARFISELRQYDNALLERLKHTPRVSYLLVHDGFSRFEAHYELGPGEIVMKSEGQPPGARHIAELREQLLAGRYRCVFREPQYSVALLDALLNEVDVPVIELDLLGLRLTEGDDFLQLYRSLGEAYLQCAARA